MRTSIKEIAIYIQQHTKYNFSNMENEHFPKKQKPKNIFVTPKQIGNFKNFEELFDHFPPMLSGYNTSVSDKFKLQNFDLITWFLVTCE